MQNFYINTSSRNEKFTQKVQIVWAKERRIGLKFIHVTREQKKKINGIIKKLQDKKVKRDGIEEEVPKK